MFVGEEVVQNGVDRPSGEHLLLDLVEERDESLMLVALGVAAMTVLSKLISAANRVVE